MSDLNQRYPGLSWIPLVGLLLAFVAVVVVYFTVSGTPLYRLTVVIGYAVLILLFFFGLLVLFAIATGRIDLSLLLSEAGGGASMSRFQLLIFTFLIAFSLFLMIVSSGPPLSFPKIPVEILTLLGISASTYAVSKGIQASNPDLTKKDGPPGQGADPANKTTTVLQDPSDGTITTIVHDQATGQTLKKVHKPSTGEITTTLHTPTTVQTRTTVDPPPRSDEER